MISDVIENINASLHFCLFKAFSKFFQSFQVLGVLTKISNYKLCRVSI